RSVSSSTSATRRSARSSGNPSQWTATTRPSGKRSRTSAPSTERSRRARGRLHAVAKPPALRRKGIWDWVTEHYEKQKQERQDFWANVAARGEQRGGVLGRAQYWA